MFATMSVHTLMDLGVTSLQSIRYTTEEFDFTTAIIIYIYILHILYILSIVMYIICAHACTCTNVVNINSEFNQL